eukprot:scaffold8253_cov267-Pinguiococcus_pyrenoidosus.AAC.5
MGKEGGAETGEEAAADVTQSFFTLMSTRTAMYTIQGERERERVLESVPEREFQRELQNTIDPSSHGGSLVAALRRCAGAPGDPVRAGHPAQGDALAADLL